MPHFGLTLKKTSRATAAPAGGTPAAPVGGVLPGAVPPSWFKEEDDSPASVVAGPATPGAPPSWLKPEEAATPSNPWLKPAPATPATPWLSAAPAMPPPATATAASLPAGPGLSPNAEIARMEAETEGHELAIGAAVQRTLRVAAATVETGAATLGALSEQGEQLRRIDGDQGRIQRNLDTSDKVLKNMTSFLGWRSWGRKAPGGKASPGQTHGAAPHAGAPAGAAGVGAAGVGAAGAGAGAGGSEQADAPDALDALGGMVATMNAQALAMRDELTTQSGQIDSLVAKTEEQRAQMGKTVKAVASVGGASARRAAQGLQTAEDTAVGAARKRAMGARETALRDGREV